jgi:hypothetical protein
MSMAMEEAVVTNFKTLCHHSPGRVEEKYETSVTGI